MRKGLAALVFFMAASSASASILFEPYAKYSMGSLQADTVSTGVTSKWKANGYGVGGRLGFQGSHLFLAGDYGYVFGGKLTADGGNAVDVDNFKEQQLGAVVGLRFNMLRVWAGYDFTNEFRFDSSGVTTKYFGGNAMKAGVGVDFHPISLNVEYVMSTYSKMNTGGADQDISAAGLSNVKGAAIVISLSAPL